MHRRAKRLLDNILPEAEFANKCLGLFGARKLMLTFEHLEEPAVDARRNDDQVVVIVPATCALHRHAVCMPCHIGHELWHDRGALFPRQLQQVAVEAVCVERLGLLRAVAPVDRRDALFVQRRFDLDITDIHMQRVRLDTALHDVVRQADALGREALHQRLGDDATAMVAACRSALAETARFKNVDVNVEADRLGHGQQEVAEHGAGRSGANYGNPGAVVKLFRAMLALLRLFCLREPLSVDLAHRRILLRGRQAVFLYAASRSVRSRIL